MGDERMWTGPEKVRRALAIAGGWEWCEEHRNFPFRAGGCGPLHPLVACPHSMECLARDDASCICGAEALGASLPAVDGCTCTHRWKAFGVLHGVSMGHGWVRMDTAADCPLHTTRVREHGRRPRRGR